MKKKKANIKMSFPRNVVGNLPFSGSLIKEKQHFYFIKQAEDPRVLAGRATSGMTGLFYHGNNAFTLIELLVVVLIIGILAAVALPQYKLAVQKAELANYRSLANAVAQGAISHHLASGEWPQNIDELDISLPQLGQNSLYWAGCVYNSKMYCCLSRPSAGSTGSVTCGKADYSFAYINLFADSTGQIKNQHSCFSKSGLKICEATGGTHNNDNAYLATPTGPVGSMHEYVYRGAER